MRSTTFEPHPMGAGAINAANRVRETAEEMEAVIALSCPPSRERSLAMTKLEECCMWAVKSLAVHGASEGEPL